MSLKMQLAIKGNRLTIRLVGELDQSNVNIIKSRVIDISKKYSIINYIINMEHLSFMDSSGIGFIIARYSNIKRMGGSIVLCSLNETIDKIVRISGLSRLVRVVDNEEIADRVLGVAI